MREIESFDEQSIERVRERSVAPEDFTFPNDDRLERGLYKITAGDPPEDYVADNVTHEVARRFARRMTEFHRGGVVLSGPEVVYDTQTSAQD